MPFGGGGGGDLPNHEHPIFYRTNLGTAVN